MRVSGFCAEALTAWRNDVVEVDRVPLETSIAPR